VRRRADRPPSLLPMEAEPVRPPPAPPGMAGGRPAPSPYPPAAAAHTQLLYHKAQARRVAPPSSVALPRPLRRRCRRSSLDLVRKTGWCEHGPRLLLRAGGSLMGSFSVPAALARCMTLCGLELVAVGLRNHLDGAGLGCVQVLCGTQDKMDHLGLRMGPPVVHS
jgi:hypothetical protein